MVSSTGLGFCNLPVPGTSSPFSSSMLSRGGLQTRQTVQEGHFWALHAAVCPAHSEPILRGLFSNHKYPFPLLVWKPWARWPLQAHLVLHVPDSALTCQVDSWFALGRGPWALWKWTWALVLGAFLQMGRNHLKEGVHWWQRPLVWVNTFDGSFFWQVSTIVYVACSSRRSIAVSPWKVSRTVNLLALRWSCDFSLPELCQVLSPNSWIYTLDLHLPKVWFTLILPPPPQARG